MNGTPSPFHTALGVGNNIAAGVKSYQDRTAIDEIIEKAHQTGNPEDVDYAMTQILSRVSPERQQVALALLQKKRADIEAKNEKTRIKQALQAQGLPDYLADYSPEMQKQYFKQIEDNRKRTARQNAYQAANLPASYADLDPLTQRTLIQKQDTDALFNQILNGISPQGAPGVPAIQPSSSMASPVEKSPAMVESPFEAAQPDIGNILDQYSPAPPVQQPTGMQRFSDEQLVAFRGLKGSPISAVADAELKRRQEDRKLSADEKKQKRKEQLEFHRESSNYDTDVMNKAKIARKQLEAVKDIRKSIESGKVKPRSIANFFSGLGNIGSKISEAFKTAEQGQFEAAMPLLVEGWKDVFGTRITDADLKLIQSKLPSIGKSKEANEAILNVIEKYARPHLIRDEVSRELKKKYNNLRPLGFEQMVEEETQRRLELATPTSEKTTIIITPTGKRKQIPISDLDKVLNAGARVE